MNRPPIQEIKKYLFWAILAALLITSIFIIKPYLIALVSAFILAYLVKPLHSILSKKVNTKLSAIICIILILGTLILPIALLLGSIISQINTSLGFDLNNISDSITSIPQLNKINFNFIKTEILSLLSSLLQSTLIHLPRMIISGLIILLGIYYILINWGSLSSDLQTFLPFKNKKRIREEISITTKNIVYGYLFIAFLEFMIGLTGFYLAGVQAFLILAILIAFLAFIPGLGPAAVWVPTSIYYLINEQYSTAIGVIITGTVISLIIETLLLGKILGSKSKIHPLIFLLGVLGGVSIFGIFGFIIGPLILVYSIKIIHESVKEN